MLASLSIRDFVLIERLDIDFNPGFTALTGETGAGKSILLDALGLACGAKADSAQVRNGCARAEISAVFLFKPKSPVAKWLAETASDEGNGSLVLRRVIEAEGRSRAFINGRPAALAELRALGELLVDVHAQHEHQTLTKPATQRALLDAFCGAADARERVAASWSAHQTAQRALEQARAAADAIAREQADLKERGDFLRALTPTAAEWTRLCDEQSRMANAQTLIDAASAAANALTDQEGALSEALGNVQTRLQAAAKFDPALAAIAEMLDTALIHVDEAGHGLRAYVEKFDLDPDRARDVDARMRALHDAARRFRVPVEQLEGLAAQTAQRLTALAQSADIPALENAVTVAESGLRAACETLTQKRTSGAKRLEKNVTPLAKSLALGNATFDVQLQPLTTPTSFGAEEICFRFSAHPSLPLQPIQKSASGGELARVALAIMVALAQAEGVPTLVFDEVDVGIGGGVAAVVGGNLRALGAKRQVFAVTHQAQVAAYSDAHYAVRKHESAAKRGVSLDMLSDAQRTEELARMIAGAETTATTRAHAAELLSAGQSGISA